MKIEVELSLDFVESVRSHAEIKGMSEGEYIELLAKFGHNYLLNNDLPSSFIADSLMALEERGVLKDRWKDFFEDPSFVSDDFGNNRN